MGAPASKPEEEETAARKRLQKHQSSLRRQAHKKLEQATRVVRRQARGGTFCGGHWVCHARRTHRYNRWVPFTCSIHVTFGPRIHVPATVRRSGDAPAAGFSFWFPLAFCARSLYQSCHLNPCLGTMASISQMGLWNTWACGAKGRCRDLNSTQTVGFPWSNDPIFPKLRPYNLCVSH